MAAPQPHRWGDAPPGGRAVPLFSWCPSIPALLCPAAAGAVGRETLVRCTGLQLRNRLLLRLRDGAWKPWRKEDGGGP